MICLGYTQWAVAASPDVKAMAMQVTLTDFSKMTYSGNAFALQNAITWTHIKMKHQVFFILRFMIAQILRILLIGKKQWHRLPLAGMDERVIGERVGFWQDWLQHSSSPDCGWAPMKFRPAIDNIKHPISMVAGWYDIFVLWQMHDLAALRQPTMKLPPGVHRNAIVLAMSSTVPRR